MVLEFGIHYVEGYNETLTVFKGEVLPNLSSSINGCTGIDSRETWISGIYHQSGSQKNNNLQQCFPSYRTERTESIKEI